MVDQRISKLANILVNYSIKVKPKDIIQIGFPVEAAPLALECYRLILEKGAIPSIQPRLPGFLYTYYKHAPMDIINTFPKVAFFEQKNVNGNIFILGSKNSKELTNIDSTKLSAREKLLKPISDLRLKRNNWVICPYPNFSSAQDAEMSYEEYEDFVYNACLKDWKTESKKQDKLKSIVDKGSTVRIVGKNTDLTFSIKGRKGIKCDGKRNMPDGEVFVAPVDNSANGYITYDFPAIRSGKEISGIRLEFKNGVVIKAFAEKNNDYLQKILATDKGSKRLGEFGIGLNYGITKFTKEILFDEKIGGTIHLALGNAYKEGGGKNKSAIHWDMIKDLRNNGELYIDGKLIQKNGKFTFKL